ncbi:MAG TPA: YbaB/EbfC family nucleoid-associated protein [Pseudonocardiaceae bacterium]|nr:YbaB/EbfC family nucleoid-associated protein [Pseudonocardiaceae bacterium]
MPDDESLEAVLARAERVQQEVRDRRRQAESQVLRAHDDGLLVEVGVNGLGEVVEVAVNRAEVGRVDPLVLAQAMLTAARAAQQLARNALAKPAATDLRTDGR